MLQASVDVYVRTGEGGFGHLGADPGAIALTLKLMPFSANSVESNLSPSRLYSRSFKRAFPP